jgi:hypothetical protein
LEQKISLPVVWVWAWGCNPHIVKICLETPTAGGGHGPLTDYNAIADEEEEEEY